MSPELLDPENFGLDEECLMKESDCYVLGMVIYKVLSELMPFTPAKSPTIIQKVLDHKCPARPQGIQGEWFTDGIWKMVGLCWNMNHLTDQVLTMCSGVCKRLGDHCHPLLT